MKIDWEQDACLTPVTEESYSSLLLLVADCCAVVEGIPLPGAAHVLLTDDAHIRDVNLTYRDIDRATDVLSFPTISYSPGHTARRSPRSLKREYDPELSACFLGDILISRDRASAQAAEYGHSLRRELCYLLAHGIFHLFGYDHIAPEDQKEMRIMEEKALELAGVSRDGSPASIPSDSQLLALAREAMQRSYSPYSHFRVGACLLSEDGRVFQGCNVENASFGLTNCAERTAVFTAISEGATGFVTIAIAAERSAPWPCGACRQVLNEFSPAIRVLVTWDGNQVAEAPLSVLLPHGFGPKDLP